MFTSLWLEAGGWQSARVQRLTFLRLLSQAKLPLISSLCNKGLRDRHWKAVSDVLGYRFKPDEKTTLKSVLSDGLDSKLEELEEISGQASKEFSLEKAPDEMLAERSLFI